MRVALLALPTALALLALHGLREEEAQVRGRGRGRAEAAVQPALLAAPLQESDPLAAAPAARPESPAHVWQLLVLDGQDVPIRCAPVAWGAKRETRTDEQGRAALEAPESAAPLGVSVLGQEFALVSSPAVVRIVGAMPVEAVVVDVANGAEIPGARVEFLSPSHILPGASIVARLRVSPPDGRGFQAPFSHDLWPEVSALADRVRAVVPVRREKVLALHVLEFDGRAAFGAGVQRVLMGGAPPNFLSREATEFPELEVVEDAGGRAPLPFLAATAADDGWITLRGVPFLQGETVHVIVEDSKGERLTAATFRLGERVAPAFVTLPSEPCGEVFECSTSCSWG
ncbi:MAG: hypothetical protein ACT4PV_07315 [Planctomycetaceae bacterium]